MTKPVITLINPKVDGVQHCSDPFHYKLHVGKNVLAAKRVTLDAGEIDERFEFVCQACVLEYVRRINYRPIRKGSCERCGVKGVVVYPRRVLVVQRRPVNIIKQMCQNCCRIVDNEAIMLDPSDGDFEGVGDVQSERTVSVLNRLQGNDPNTNEDCLQY